MLEKRRHRVCVFAEEEKLQTLAREARTRMEVGSEGKLWQRQRMSRGKSRSHDMGVRVAGWEYWPIRVKGFYLGTVRMC
jgi:hypothetical protein